MIHGKEFTVLPFYKKGLSFYSSTKKGLLFSDEVVVLPFGEKDSFAMFKDE